MHIGKIREVCMGLDLKVAGLMEQNIWFNKGIFILRYFLLSKVFSSLVTTTGDSVNMLLR